MGIAMPKFFILYLFFFVIQKHVCAAVKNGIVGFGISLFQDLCCQSCHDSLSSLYLTCTTFDDQGGGGMHGMDMDMGSMGMGMGETSEECYATNIPWLQTMAYCIQQNCNADGYYGVEKQSSCFRTLTQAAAGGNALTPTFEDSLPATAPTVELSEDDLWLNVTSLVNRNTYYATHGTLKEFARSEYIHTRYSVLLYLIVIGICIGCGILAQTRSTFPALEKTLQRSTFWAKLQQYIFIPALFDGSRHLEPLPGQIGYVPGRTLSIFIGIYLLLNVILSSVSYRNFWPNVWFSSKQFEMCEYVGNRTGTLSLVNISIAILFAGRNNILIALTGWSQTTFLTFHRWAARVATLQAVVHSIAYTLAYFEPPTGGAAAYAAEAAKAFYWWGIIATIALCLATAFAILPLRIKFYEFFLISHIALVILALVGCWYHLVPHFGYDYGYQVWLYIAFAFWSADRLARLVRVAYYNRVGSSTAIVEALPGCEDIMQLSVFPRVPWHFGPGQHSFLYLPELGRFWESHPFSVAGWKSQEHQAAATASTSGSLSDSTVEGEKVKDSGLVSVATEKDSPPYSTAKKGGGRRATTVSHQTKIQKNRASVQFLIRAHSGMTSNLQRRLFSSSPSSCSSMEISVYTEGPYAGHRATLQQLFVTETVLCLVGGIGITNALGYVQEYTSANAKNLDGRKGDESTGTGTTEKKKSGRGGVGTTLMKNTTRFILAWSAREIGLIEHVKKNFLLQEDDDNDVKGMEYSLWCTGPLLPSSNNTDTQQKLDSLNNERSQRDLSPRRSSPTSSAAAVAVVVRQGRMDIGTVIRSSLEVGHHTTVLVCGPGSMADEATRQVVNCVKDGFKVDLIEESYAW